MTKTLFQTLTAAGRVFAVTFLFSAVGILNAPNLDAALALSLAALVGAIAAVLRVIQVIVPKITTKGIFGEVVGAWVDSGLRAFLATLLALTTGWLAAPDWSTWRSAGTAIVIAAATAAVRALQGLATAGESPAPHLGG